MDNTNAVDVKNIKVGDFVKVKGCTGNRDEAHWGRSLAPWDGKYIYTKMEDRSLMRAEAHWCAVENRSCYMAVEEEVVKHIPKDKVAMHGGTPVNVEDHGQPKTLTVHDDIQATLDYLERVTGKKHTPETQEIELGVPNHGSGHSGYIMIKFRKEDK